MSRVAKVWGDEGHKVVDSYLNGERQETRFYVTDGRIGRALFGLKMRGLKMRGYRIDETDPPQQPEYRELSLSLL